MARLVAGVHLEVTQLLLVLLALAVVVAVQVQAFKMDCLEDQEAAVVVFLAVQVVPQLPQGVALEIAVATAFLVSFHRLETVAAVAQEQQEGQVQELAKAETENRLVLLALQQHTLAVAVEELYLLALVVLAVVVRKIHLVRLILEAAEEVVIAAREALAVPVS